MASDAIWSMEQGPRSTDASGSELAPARNIGSRRPRRLGELHNHGLVPSHVVLVGQSPSVHQFQIESGDESKTLDFCAGRCLERRPELSQGIRG